MPIKVFESLLAESVYNFFFAVVIVMYRHVWTCLDKSENILRILPNHIIEFGVLQNFMLLNQIFALEGKNTSQFLYEIWYFRP